MGTTNETSARKTLEKFSKKNADPVTVRRNSLSYVRGYERLKTVDRHNDYDTFIRRWRENSQPYPDKDDTHFIVDSQCMWTCGHEKDINAFRGKVTDPTFAAVRSRLVRDKDTFPATED